MTQIKTAFLLEKTRAWIFLSLESQTKGGHDRDLEMYA